MKLMYMMGFIIGSIMIENRGMDVSNYKITQKRIYNGTYYIETVNQSNNFDTWFMYASSQKKFIGIEFQESIERRLRTRRGLSIGSALAEKLFKQLAGSSFDVKKLEEAK